MERLIARGELQQGEADILASDRLHPRSPAARGRANRRRQDQRKRDENVRRAWLALEKEPRILNAIVKHAFPATLTSLRLVSRPLKHAADGCLAKHIVFSDDGDRRSTLCRLWCDDWAPSPLVRVLDIVCNKPQGIPVDLLRHPDEPKRRRLFPSLRIARLIGHPDAWPAASRQRVPTVIVPHVPSAIEGRFTINVPRGCERIVVVTSLERRTERPDGFLIKMADSRKGDEAPELELCFLPGVERNSGTMDEASLVQMIQKLLSSGIRGLKEGTVDRMTLVGLTARKGALKKGCALINEQLRGLGILNSFDYETREDWARRSGTQFVELVSGAHAHQKAWKEGLERVAFLENKGELRSRKRSRKS